MTGETPLVQCPTVLATDAADKPSFGGPADVDLRLTSLVQGSLLGAFCFCAPSDLERTWWLVEGGPVNERRRAALPGS
jgi:hypothetical protein